MENNTENGNSGGNRPSKVLLRQLPPDVDWAEIEQLASSVGEVVSCNHGGTAEAPTAIIAYRNSEQANEAVEKLDKKEVNGVPIKASVFVERGRNARRGGGGIGNRGYQNALGASAVGYLPHQISNPAQAGLPLRMVVGARYVGAIIGQGGANIREITRESKARCVVDVNRGMRDQTGNVEKIINIYGTPESCSKACSKILEVVQRELGKDPANEGKTIEPELKLRAHNNLVGRLIGKAGSTIKKIMEETGCTIFVSNINELTPFNVERTITVRGTLENISQAEGKISCKLRQCWENDVANAPNPAYGGVHPFVSIPQVGGPVDPYCYSAIPGGMQPTFVPSVQTMGAIGGRPQAAPLHTVAQQPIASAFPPVAAGAGPAGHIEVVHVWVPNHVVGALIGTKGVHIKNIMSLTGAHIRIESTKGEVGPAGDQQQQQQPEKQEEASQSQESQSSGGGGDRQQASNERRVTITGTDQQQYRAQYWIFQRLSEHGHHFDEVRLCTELQVPSKLVGRIIGKGGQNVRELQRVTGAQVKIPEDAATQDENEDTLVRIIGNFNASQAVQARIRQLVYQFNNQQQGPARSQSADHQPQRAEAGHGVNHYGEEHE